MFTVAPETVHGINTVDFRGVQISEPHAPVACKHKGTHSVVDNALVCGECGQRFYQATVACLSSSHCGKNGNAFCVACAP